MSEPNPANQQSTPKRTKRTLCPLRVHTFVIDLSDVYPVTHAADGQGREGLFSLGGLATTLTAMGKGGRWW
jgi:hypothetical protein